MRSAPWQRWVMRATYAAHSGEPQPRLEVDGGCPRVGGRTFLRDTERLDRDLNWPVRVLVAHGTLQGETGPADRVPVFYDEWLRASAIADTATNVIGMPSPA